MAGVLASLGSGLLPFKNPTSCVSKRQLSRLSVMDAGHRTFCVGVRPESNGPGTISRAPALRLFDIIQSEVTMVGKGPYR